METAVGPFSCLSPERPSIFAGDAASEPRRRAQGGQHPILAAIAGDV